MAEAKRSNRCVETTCVVCSCCWALVFLGGAIATLFVLYASQQEAHKECWGNFGPIVYLHRGNLTHAQENTLGSVVAGSAGFDANPEMDIMTTSDGVAVLHHDKSLKRMTGVDEDIEKTSWDEVKDLTVLQVIDGYDYGSTSRIPSVTEVMDEICTVADGVAIDFDVKTNDAAEQSVVALKNSNCDAKEESIFATGLPTVGRTLSKKIEDEGLDNHVSVFLHPGSYSVLGLYFFLKTGIFQYAAGASMISLHKTVWDKDEETIREYQDLGYCTGIYGIRPDEVDNYPDISYYVVDEGPSFPDTPNGQYGGDGGTDIVEYDGSRAGFYGILALGILCFPFFILCLVWMCLSCRRCRRAAQPE